MHREERTTIYHLENILILGFACIQWAADKQSLMSIFTTRTILLTAGGHEAVYLIWTQIVEVVRKAPSAEVLHCWAQSRRLDHVFWTRHRNVVQASNFRVLKTKNKDIWIRSDLDQTNANITPGFYKKSTECWDFESHIQSSPYELCMCRSCSSSCISSGCNSSCGLVSIRLSGISSRPNNRGSWRVNDKQTSRFITRLVSLRMAPHHDQRGKSMEVQLSITQNNNRLINTTVLRWKVARKIWRCGSLVVLSRVPGARGCDIKDYVSPVERKGCVWTLLNSMCGEWLNFSLEQKAKERMCETGRVERVGKRAGNLQEEASRKHI